MSAENPMADQIRQLFTVGECLSVNNSKNFCVVEDETKKAIINHESLEDGFTVINPESKSIFLLAIDQCLLKEIKEGQRCDCALFDDETFCFAELKLDVHKKKQATKKLKEARDQLGSTIQYFRKVFKANNKDFLGYKQEAYAVMRSHIYPQNNAQRGDVFLEFLEDYGVRLYETNQKTFGAKREDA